MKNERKNRTKQQPQKSGMLYLSVIGVFFGVFLAAVAVSFVVTYRQVLATNTQNMQSAAKLYAEEIGANLKQAQAQLVRLGSDETVCGFLAAADSDAAHGFASDFDTRKVDAASLPDSAAHGATPYSADDVARRLSWQTQVLAGALPVLEYISYVLPSGAPLALSGTVISDRAVLDVIAWLNENALAAVGSRINDSPLLVTLPDTVASYNGAPVPDTNAATETPDSPDVNDSLEALDTTAAKAANSPYFIVPAVHGGKLCGYIVAKVSRTYLNGFFRKQELSKGTSVYILDRYLNLLYGDMDKNEWAQLVQTQKSFAESLSPREGNLSGVFRYENRTPCYGTSAINRDFNIILLLSIDRASLARETFVSLYLMIVISLFMIAVAAAIDIYLYRRLDSPLEEMVSQCLQIKNGNAGERFKQFADKSLNILAETLNETMESIGAYQANLEVMAFTDPLLGIGNRSACIRNLEHFIRTEKKDFSIFMIDVVDFDHFNELFSVKAGDMLLRKIATMLDTISSSNVYRYNGDTFLLFIPGMDSAKCMQVTREIKEYFAKPVLLPNAKYPIAMNAGRADFPDHGSTAAELIRNCKTALKYSKSLSANNLCIVYNSIVNDAIGRSSIIKDLIVDAIRHPDSIEIAYQPIYSVHDNAFTRIETLFRLKSSEFEISPKEAIRIAEKNGLINDLGDIIVGNICSFSRTLQERAPDINSISINLSVLQLLQNGFFERIKKQLTASKIPFSFFEFEITESVLVNSFDSVKEKLEQFKSLGLRIALDDFGAGNSGISYLVNLPVDTLKLDRQIISDLGVSARQDTLVKSIVDGCKSFNIDIVAEGVETEQARLKAVSMGVDYIQGFYYAQPMSKARVLNFLEESRLIKQTHV